MACYYDGIIVGKCSWNGGKNSGTYWYYRSYEGDCCKIVKTKWINTDAKDDDTPDPPYPNLTGYDHRIYKYDVYTKILKYD